MSDGWNCWIGNILLLLGCKNMVFVVTKHMVYGGVNNECYHAMYASEDLKGGNLL